MNVIISIKPKYVKHILDGSKKFEFRKKIFKKEVNKVYIYASAPTMRIVASFNIQDVIMDEPSKLWERCSKYAGISSNEYDKYYSGKSIGYAIKITNLKIFKEPIIAQSVIRNFKAPQSFLYTDKDLELCSVR
ncbi:hypothetical protein [Sulfurimonas sp.]|uniref:hypothetical protein n=1 Tax=Sulfurimonas sp. TaxID=2022749 RepID=UPI00356A38A4